MFAFRQSSQPVVYRLEDARVAELDNNDRLINLMIHDKIIAFLPFKDIINYINQGYQYKLEPELDKFTSNGNSIIVLHQVRDLKLAEVCYDHITNKIFPPK